MYTLTSLFATRNNTSKRYGGRPIWLWTALIGLAVGTQQAEAAFILSDEMNATGSYEGDYFNSSSEVNDMSVFQGFTGQPTGGNPASFFRLNYFHDVGRFSNGDPFNGGSAVNISAGVLNTAFNYNPFASGSINEITFSLDIRYSNPANVFTTEMFFSINDGNPSAGSQRIYLSINPVLMGGSPIWQSNITISLSDLDLALMFPDIDFVGLDINTPELRFGFGFNTHGSISGPPELLSVDVDNFFVSINTIPEPSSAGLLALSLACLTTRKRWGDRSMKPSVN